ncbi:hypothetical protein L0222_18070 [bacterium]|nr:hypothetical protein [bacterium]
MEMVRYTIPVEFPLEMESNHSLPLLYARQKIEELSGSAVSADGEKQQKLIDEITDLSMKTGLVSAFTSFVAVDESRIVSDGRPIKIFQPAEKAEGSFGGSAFGEPVSVDSWGVQLCIKKEGEVRVSAIEESGTAAQSGVHTGARIKRINGTSVYDLGQLEGLLLQASGKVVEVELDPGGTIILPLP